MLHYPVLLIVIISIAAIQVIAVKHIDSSRPNDVSMSLFHGGVVKSKLYQRIHHLREK